MCQFLINSYCNSNKMHYDHHTKKYLTLKYEYYKSKLYTPNYFNKIKGAF